MNDKDKIAKLRAALVTLVGSDDVGELQTMKDLLKDVPVSLADQDNIKASVGAIDTLIEIRE